MSEKGLGRLRNEETAGNNKLEKEIIYDFRHRELIAHLLVNHPLVIHPSNLPRIPKWHNRQRHVAGAVFDVARWIIE